jgi:hypothetical protein
MSWGKFSLHGFYMRDHMIIVNKLSMAMSYSRLGQKIQEAGKRY